MKLSIITPRKIAKEMDISSITLPSARGEITILPVHTPLLALLEEGIITYRFDEGEDSISIGSGYVRTDGKSVHVLVSHAYGQDEIDEKMTHEAIERAQKLINESQTHGDRISAQSLLRRSLLDSKLIRKRSIHHRTVSPENM